MIARATEALIALANDGLIRIATDFESVREAGWVKIAPYGEHQHQRVVKEGPYQVPKPEFFLQRFTREAADQIVQEFKAGKSQRFTVGIPIFKRHPDLKRHSPETQGDDGEETPQGLFADLEARGDGLYGRAVLSKGGVDAIRNEGLKWLSPFWFVRLAGDAGSVKVVAPFQMISVGLTDRPNISGGEALLNQTQSNYMAGDKPGTLFLREVHALCAGGYSWHRAWSTVKDTHPQLYEAMEAASPHAIANDQYAKAQAAMREGVGHYTVMSPGTETLLTGDTAEGSVKWIEDNRPKFVLLRGQAAADAFGKIVRGIQERSKASYEDSWKRAKREFPGLFNAMSEKMGGWQNDALGQK